MTTEDPPQPQQDHESSRTLLARFRQTVAASSLNSRMVMFSGIGCAVALAILAVIAFSISRSNVMLRAPSGSAHTTASNAIPFIAKPSPIGRAQQAPQLQSPQPLQLSQPAHRLAAAPLIPLAPHRPAAPPAQERAAIVAPPAPARVEHVGPSLPFGVRMTADRDGFNNGCKRGRLVLQISTVTFTCPHDASKNVTVSAAEVKSLDNNGIIVFPRQKYHFDIAGREKQGVHELFAEWLTNARSAASARASN